MNTVETTTREPTKILPCLTAVVTCDSFVADELFGEQRLLLVVVALLNRHPLLQLIQNSIHVNPEFPQFVQVHGDVHRVRVVPGPVGEVRGGDARRRRGAFAHLQLEQFILGRPRLEDGGGDDVAATRDADEQQQPSHGRQHGSLEIKTHTIYIILKSAKFALHPQTKVLRSRLEEWEQTTHVQNVALQFVSSIL